jgi:hypothetical protein
MKKIYFIAGFLSLSLLAISCSNDDNFKDEIQKNKQSEAQPMFIPENQTNNISEEILLERGDDDLDKDKSKGPIKGKGK